MSVIFLKKIIQSIISGSDGSINLDMGSFTDDEIILDMGEF